MLKVEDIGSWEDCERLRKRAEVASVSLTDNAIVVRGSCTQINKVIVLDPNQAAPTINVQVPAQKAPVIQNRVIIQKEKIK